MKNWRTGLSDVDGVVELQNVVHQMDDLISAIEKRLAKLKQAVAIREQFIDLVTDVNMFVTQYTEVVREIERPGYTIQDKIKKYEEVIAKIQEYEAKLVSASDKGEQIANEGTVIDRNNIMEQLQQLKQQLLSLRKVVEQQIQQHEATAAEQAKLVKELEEVIDWVYAHEAQIQSRPLLLISIESVKDEINKHQVSYSIEKS